MKAEEERDAAVAALGDLLSVAERMIGGDSSLDPEEWYAIRDYCRIKLASLSAADTEQETLCSCEGRETYPCDGRGPCVDPTERQAG
jgi:hypothetical protein